MPGEATRAERDPGTRQRVPLVLPSILLACALALAGPATLATPAYDATQEAPGCISTADLVSFVTCMKGRMPGRDSGGYQVPTEDELAQWRDATTLLTSLPCPLAALLDPTGPAFEIHTLEDEATGRSYCVLHEVGDADGDGVLDHGWGAVIVDTSPARDLNVHVPHPLFDIGTPEQGAGLIRATGGASMVLAGAHRYALDAPPGGHAPSDPAHGTGTPLHAAVAAIVTHRETLRASSVHVQLHGMASGSCPDVDVHVTNGTTLVPGPGDPLLVLRDALREQRPDWTVIVPGDPPGCHLSGTTNVQGPVVRGAGQVFFHVESEREDRLAAPWADAIRESGVAPRWPLAGPQPGGSMARS